MHAARSVSVIRPLLLALLLAMGIVQPSLAARLPPIADTPAGPYRLGTGDEVRVNVFGLDVASNSYAIGDDGTISIPLLGLIAADGKSLPELEAAIAAGLRQKDVVRQPSVSVQMTRYRPFFILGEVQKPGQYPYVPGMSVLTAVSIAGGFTFRADERRAVILRASEGRMLRGKATPETRVQPGDTVNIAEGWF